MSKTDLFGSDLFGSPKPELHHGDCIGSDADMHRLARVQGMKVVLHPADPGKMKTKGLRAWCEGDECQSPVAPLTRNRTIARLWPARKAQ